MKILHDGELVDVGRQNLEKNGMLVVVDGPDGAGKSKLCRKLEHLLHVAGRAVCLTAEPYLPMTRAWLSDPAVTPRELAVAFAHDRHRHMHEVVRPALADGCVVICDRYVLSTIVYQSMHNDPAFIAALVADAREPDLTFVVVAPTEVCMARLAATGKTPDRFEADAALQAATRQRYIDLAIQRGYTVLDGTMDAEALARQVFAVVADRIPE